MRQSHPQKAAISSGAASIAGHASALAASRAVQPAMSIARTARPSCAPSPACSGCRRRAQTSGPSRAAAGIRISGGNVRASTIPWSNSVLASSWTAIATTPKLPICGSAITACIRARSPCAAPRPSARSPSPSRCSAPVTATHATSAVSAPVQGSSWAPAQAAPATIAPTISPTAGNQRIEAAKSAPSARTGGSGSRVRNCTASTNRLMAIGRRSGRRAPHPARRGAREALHRADRPPRAGAAQSRTGPRVPRASRRHA